MVAGGWQLVNGGWGRSAACTACLRPGAWLTRAPRWLPAPRALQAGQAERVSVLEERKAALQKGGKRQKSKH
jgi:hypothetical protein